MPQELNDLMGPKWPGYEPAKVSFPSDSLSIKRLRTIFPHMFDKQDSIEGGYTECKFFFPSGAEEPDHLMRLTELLCDERTIAGGAYWRESDPSVLNDEDREIIKESVQRLEANYQTFKLADSPEAAAHLIRLVEEEGRQQARSGPAQHR